MKLKRKLPGKDDQEKEINVERISEDSWRSINTAKRRRALVSGQSAEGRRYETRLIKKCLHGVSKGCHFIVTSLIKVEEIAPHGMTYRNQESWLITEKKK